MEPSPHFWGGCQPGHGAGVVLLVFSNPSEPVMTTTNWLRVCPVLTAACELTPEPHSVHLMLVMDAGLLQLAVGFRDGSRS